MPVGIQRLNARRTQPNPNIVFIKPLPGPDSAIAESFLERIAAQCLPIMKEHHLSVVTLEEYEPNREFVGRNFNAGEVIQLVLKSARPPHRWLPFRYVQMVMMHELAHCTQMNHSRAFWAVRNAYAASMTALWAKGYTGEGLWGRGAALATGAWERNAVDEGEPLPDHLCGGTYRSRRRGRKRKPKLSWREQKERRIAKKFGTNGMALGADESEKVKLEGGKKVVGKPRVAGSARGRELRAAAALARFDKQKVEDEEAVLKDEEADYETASGSDYEEEEGVDAVDLDGKTMKDKDGCALVKVCEDEDGNDPAARDELEELRRVFVQPPDAASRVAAITFEQGESAAAGVDAGPPRIKNEPDGCAGPPRIKNEPDGCAGRPRVKNEPGSSHGADRPQDVPAVASSSSAGPPSPPLRLHDIPHIRDAPPSKLAAVRRRDLATSENRIERPAAAAGASTPDSKPKITIHRLPATAPRQQRPPPPPVPPAKEEAPPMDGGSGSAAAAAAAAAPSRPKITIHRLPAAAPSQQRPPPPPAPPVKEDALPTSDSSRPVAAAAGTCPVCTLDNDTSALRCAACAHVLRPDVMLDSWACSGASCGVSGYVNAGDCGVCGLCGGRRS